MLVCIFVYIYMCECALSYVCECVFSDVFMCVCVRACVPCTCIFVCARVPSRESRREGFIFKSPAVVAASLRPSKHRKATRPTSTSAGRRQSHTAVHQCRSTSKEQQHQTVQRQLPRGAATRVVIFTLQTLIHYLHFWRCTNRDVRFLCSIYFIFVIAVVGPLILLFEFSRFQTRTLSSCTEISVCSQNRPYADCNSNSHIGTYRTITCTRIIQLLCIVYVGILCFKYFKFNWNVRIKCISRNHNYIDYIIQFGRFKSAVLLCIWSVYSRSLINAR